MPKLNYFSNDAEFQKEFERCCNDYESLSMYVAWVGNPNNKIPFNHLNNLSKVVATVGISLSQSHPDGIRFLMDLNADVRIIKDEKLFHPKIYIFSQNDKRAVFIGSSNFTHAGFYKNYEANVLIEGIKGDEVIADVESKAADWRLPKVSFVPDAVWLEKYTKRFAERQRKLDEAKEKDEAMREDEWVGKGAWLINAGWNVYINEVNKGLKNYAEKYREDLEAKLNIFKKYSVELAVPWSTEYFKEIEKRRMLLGLNQYAGLGNVGANGRFRKLLKNGANEQHATIVNAINSITALNAPIDWDALRENLESLVALGPSMKVWGRFLAIVRPDLYCTISSPQVRRNISKLLGWSEESLSGVDGYINLLQLIHASPWFKSNQPTNKNETAIWEKRVAFLDVVFYK